MWRRYRCIYVLRDSSIFLGGISLRLLRETKHGSGWALATAPPLCLFLQVWLSPQAHTRLPGALSGCHGGAPGEGFPMTERSLADAGCTASPGALPGQSQVAPSHPLQAPASGLRSLSSCCLGKAPVLLHRLLPPFLPRRKEGSAGDSHRAAPPTAHRSDLGHQRISVDLPPSLLRPRREWNGSQGSMKKPVVKHKPRLHLCEATNQCHKRARGGFTAASASSSTPAPCPPAPHGRRRSPPAAHRGGPGVGAPLQAPALPAGLRQPQSPPKSLV